MNKQEYLLVKLMEECAEVSKACAKILRFGLNNKKPDSSFTNKEELKSEITDVFAIFAMLVCEEIVELGEYTEHQMDTSIKKVRHYMNISKELGTLTDENTFYS